MNGKKNKPKQEKKKKKKKQKKKKQNLKIQTLKSKIKNASDHQNRKIKVYKTITILKS